MITKLSQLDFNKKYTYADYLTWRLKERVELIKGYISRMSPAPTRIHQEISGIIFNSMYSFLKGKQCSVYSAPFDVRFFSETETGEIIQENVVQPDICVICDPDKLDDKGCLGAPDLIVEILSPSTSEKDLTYKYDLYRLNGVKEYWVVSPEDKHLAIYLLNDTGDYIPSRLYTRGNTVSSTVLTGFTLDLSEVFEPFDWKVLEEQEKYYNRI